MTIRSTAAVTAVGLALFFAGAANAEDEGWKGDLGLSFTQQSGTTETVAGTLDVKLGRNWENDELALRALANYGASERRARASVSRECPLRR